MIACLHATLREDDWRRSSMFHTYFAYEGKNYKVIIDGGSCVNIISTTAVEKMGLEAEPYPQPYNVTLVDKNFHSITQCSFVPSQFSRLSCSYLV